MACYVITVMDAFSTLQGQLWELDGTLWQLAKRLPDYAPRRKCTVQPKPIQLPLLEDAKATREEE